MPVQQLATNSLISFCNSQGDEARGTLLKLTRSTVIFEVYNPYSLVQLSEVLTDLTILRGQYTIYKGRVVVSNLVNTGLIIIVSATLIDPWLDLSEILDKGSEIKNEVTQFINDWENSNKLGSAYQLAVNKLRSFLGDLNHWLEQVELLSDDNNDNDKFALSQKQFDELTIPILESLNTLFTKFEKEAEKISKEDVFYHKIFTQRDLHPLMMQAPFLYRAYHKPLGYAGDYEMVNMMLNNEREGASTYSQLINNLYLRLAPAEAHRNRIEILIDYLKKASDRKTVKILNIGCGPAMEIQRFIKEYEHSNSCDFHLIDFNKETIEYAGQKLNEAIEESGNKPVINFTQMSVHSLLKQSSKNKNKQDFEKYDYVYCAGLFDYLSDKVCIKLIDLFYTYLVPGGKLLVTNVHSDNPNRLTMEHIAEWYLIYRDEVEIEKLANKYEHKHVFVDKTGINIFLEINKNGST